MSGQLKGGRVAGTLLTPEKRREIEAKIKERDAQGKLKRVTEDQKRRADNSEALAWN
jgi:hypothetical protein